MRTVNPANLKELDKIVVLGPSGRGYTREEILFMVRPECGHDHDDEFIENLEQALKDGRLRSYELHGETYYCPTYLGVYAEAARSSVN